MTEVVEMTRRTDAGARYGMSLSPRELEVLDQLSRGNSYADIAEALQISLDTVKSHLKRTFVKLGARTGAHAVGIACRTGALHGGGEAA